MSQNRINKLRRVKIHKLVNKKLLIKLSVKNKFKKKKKQTINRTGYFKIQ